MAKKHILIGGGTGFIGTAIARRLRARGDRVTLISRKPGRDRITWTDLARDGLPECDAVINLAGKHILDPTRRWCERYRDEVIQSRVQTTRMLVDAINAASVPPEVFVSTAGKCRYGIGRRQESFRYKDLDEDSEPVGIDFPAELVGIWERAADHIDTSRVRHARLRIGLVLGAVRREGLLGRLWRIGKSEGFLPLIRLPFCLGVGAILGNGRQPFPWIHIDDMAGIALHVLDTPSAQGTYNCVAPGIVSSAEFTNAFAKQLRRPVVWRAPQSLIVWLVGEERASILLEGQQVRPRRTLEVGYRFSYPSIGPALDDLVQITF
ncbi:MAG: TIGR01777 family oxidoreductase [Pseudomonadota bacterium]